MCPVHGQGGRGCCGAGRAVKVYRVVLAKATPSISMPAARHGPLDLDEDGTFKVFSPHPL